MALLLSVYLTPPPHTVRGLAQSLKVSKPAITRAVNRLSELGLARRKTDEADRRSVFIQRTVKGSMFLREFGELIVSAANADDANGLPLILNRVPRSGGGVALADRWPEAAEVRRQDRLRGHRIDAEVPEPVGASCYHVVAHEKADLVAGQERFRPQFQEPGVEFGQAERNRHQEALASRFA